MINTPPLRTADHWWWRPGWGPGARCHTVHITFQDQPALHAHAQAWRQVLARFPQLDLVPDPWLHLTMQGLGMQGEVTLADVTAIADRAEDLVAKLEPFELSVGAPSFTPEAIRFDPSPAAPVAKLRSAVRGTIGEVWPKVPEADDGFEPHITIGYGNADADATEIIAAIEQADIEPITIRITHADLILLGRDDKIYTWTVTQGLPLAA